MFAQRVEHFCLAHSKGAKLNLGENLPGIKAALERFFYRISRLQQFQFGHN